MPDFDKKAYDIAYAKQNIFNKRIPFNKNNPDDARMLAFLDQQPNFTQYIKGLILRDMLQRQRGKRQEEKT